MISALLAEQIRECVKAGLSHRKAAAKFHVSLRQVQTAIDPERRRQLDRDWMANNPEKARAIWRRCGRRYYYAHHEEILARKRDHYDPAARRAQYERMKSAKPQFWRQWPSYNKSSPSPP